MSAAEGREVRPDREQSGGEWPLGRHVDEEEMPSPKPVSWDSAGKTGSL